MKAPTTSSIITTNNKRFVFRTALPIEFVKFANPFSNPFESIIKSAHLGIFSSFLAV